MQNNSNGAANATTGSHPYPYWHTGTGGWCNIQVLKPKAFDYFEREKWASEPCCYYCLDTKKCDGFLTTSHGYFLVSLGGC